MVVEARRETNSGAGRWLDPRFAKRVKRGNVIAGRYRLIDRLGEGGMAVVWRAEHLALHCPVAVKFLHDDTAVTQDSRERFAREARAAAAVRHTHIAHIFDYGTSGDGTNEGNPFIVMELLHGETLEARLRRIGRLSSRAVLDVFNQIALAVSHAHSLGVIHRDIKPSNVFLAREGERELVKVLDFGIAKILDPGPRVPTDASTGAGNILGTPMYMSPEQVRGGKLDHRCDLWALAVVAFECTTGHLPFRGRNAGDLLVEICLSEPLKPSQLAASQSSEPLPSGRGSSEVDAWFARGLAKRPEERFEDALQMAEALRRAFEPRREATAPAPPPPSSVPLVESGGSTPRGAVRKAASRRVRQAFGSNWWVALTAVGVAASAVCLGRVSHPSGAPAADPTGSIAEVAAPPEAKPTRRAAGAPVQARGAAMPSPRSAGEEAVERVPALLRGGAPETRPAAWACPRAGPSESSGGTACEAPEAAVIAVRQPQGPSVAAPVGGESNRASARAARVEARPVVTEAPVEHGSPAATVARPPRARTAEASSTEPRSSIDAEPAERLQPRRARRAARRRDTVGVHGVRATSAPPRGRAKGKAPAPVTTRIRDPLAERL